MGRLYRIKNLEKEISSLRCNNQSLVQDLQRKELQIRDLDSKWLATKEELNLASQEHSQYKAKAKRVLLEKEKLISSFNETGQANGSSDPGYLKAQLDQA